MSSFRSLTLDQWPASDRNAWERACMLGARLKRGGAASHLKATTRTARQRHYGHLLDHCRRTGVLMADAPAGAHATEPILIAFLAELNTRVGSVTRPAYLESVHYVARLLDPMRDLAWLRDLVLDLKYEARPRNQQDRIVYSHILVDLGLNLMARAETAHRLTEFERARLYRDGLMVALLAMCPIRLRNLWSLDIGGRFRRTSDWWMIDLPGSETKNGHPDLRAVPALLTPHIDRWVDEWRWRAGATDDEPHMWPSIKGGQLAYTYIGTTIRQTTERELGIPVRPHLFRSCAVETVATFHGNQMGVASGVLHHRDPRVTEKHYNKGSMINAATAFAEIVEAMTVSDGRARE